MIYEKYQATTYGKAAKKVTSAATENKTPDDVTFFIYSL